MSKLLFIALCDLYDFTNGVTLKVNAQIAGFKELGFEVTSATYDKDSALIKNDHEEIRVQSIKKRRIMLFQSIIKYVKNHEIGTVFIRYPHLDFQVMRMLSVLKSKASRIILEIPSFPLEYPKHSLTVKYFHFMDIMHRKHLKKYIDVILAVGRPVEEYYTVKVVTIPNGYMHQTESKTTVYPHDPHQIDMISLTSFYETHGIDRLIEGMKIYHNQGKNETNVTIHLVGDGPKKQHLVELTKEYHLEKYVKFYPPMSHDDINQKLSFINMGCGPLALHRAGYVYGSPLKTKDYFQRGLPFIYAYEEIGITADYPYACQFSFDDSPIDIRKVISFYQSYQPDIEKAVHEMKNYGMEHFNWKNILKLGL